MMFKFAPYRSGNLAGQVYLFPKRGDGIPMHEHLDGSDHNVIVLRGAVRVYGPERIYEVELNVGSVYEFNFNGPHEIMALVDGTELLNLYLNGLPPGYANIAPEHLSGEIDRPLKHPLHV
jgi:quercetin dioxygenase-like cupin family protein